MALNDSLGGIPDSDGEYDDWIELYNNTDQPVDLSYYYLTDRYANHIKWSFPYGSVIDGNGYLTVWADGQAQQSGYHANFRLNGASDDIMLAHLNGTVIDSVSYGQQTVNLTSSRMPNGTGDFIQQAPTYNANNESVGISEQAGLNYSVYPNPANSQVLVRFGTTEATNISVSLVNPLGQEVRQFNATTASGPVRFDVSDLAGGVYILRVMSPEAGARQTPLVVRH